MEAPQTPKIKCGTIMMFSICLCPSAPAVPTPNRHLQVEKSNIITSGAADGLCRAIEHPLRR